MGAMGGSRTITINPIAHRQQPTRRFDRGSTLSYCRDHPSLFYYKIDYRFIQCSIIYSARVQSQLFSWYAVHLSSSIDG
jgi:hypothetical protein